MENKKKAGDDDKGGCGWIEWDDLPWECEVGCMGDNKVYIPDDDDPEYFMDE